MAEPLRFPEEQNLGRRGGAAAWAEAWLTRALLGGLGRLPTFAQRGLAAGAARLAFAVDERHREGARRFLTQALGEAAGRDDGRVLAAYRHLFRISIVSAAFDRRVPQARLLEHFDVEWGPGVREAVDSGRGGIMVTPHVGDWEAGSALMPHVGMSPAYVVARPPKNRYLSKHLLELRERKGLVVVPRRGGMRQVAAILEGGGWIGMLLDQRPLGKHVVAPFFGRPAPCERSAAVLMKRLGVTVVFGACYLTERPFRYRVVFARAVGAEELADLSLEELVALVNREQEARILEHPEQYFWLHDRYRDAPAQAPGTAPEPAAGPDRAPDPSKAPLGR